MGSILVRNIADDVLERFRRRARADGKSMEQLAREAIAEKALPSRQDVLDRMEALRLTSSPVDLETALRLMDEARAERDDRSADAANGHGR